MGSSHSVEILSVSLATRPAWLNRWYFPCSKEAGGSDDVVRQHPARGRLFWAPDDDENDKGITRVCPHVQSARGLICVSAAGGVPCSGFLSPFCSRGCFFCALGFKFPWSLGAASLRGVAAHGGNRYKSLRDQSSTFRQLCLCLLCGFSLVLVAILPLLVRWLRSRGARRRSPPNMFAAECGVAGSRRERSDSAWQIFFCASIGRARRKKSRLGSFFECQNMRRFTAKDVLHALHALEAAHRFGVIRRQQDALDAPHINGVRHYQQRQATKDCHLNLRFYETVWVLRLAVGVAELENDKVALVITF